LNDNQHKKELPKDWKWVKLGEYVVSVKGKKPKRISKEQTEECSIPYVNIKAFEKGIIDEYTDGVGCVLCNDGDFLMVWDGSRSGHVGKAIKGALGSTLVKLNFPDMENDYAYYFLQSKYLDINTRAKGVGIPHVDPNLLWNYDLLIPPKPTQQAIVTKIEELFSELDKGIENLRTAQQQLKTYRQSVLKWAFEGKLTTHRFDNFSKVVNSNEQDLIKKEMLQSSNSENSASDKGELPKGWKWVKLGDIAKKKSLKALPKDYPNAKFIGMDCIEPHTLKPFFLYDFKEFKSAGNFFKTNQVLYGRMRPYLNKVYKAEFDGTCSGEFIILDCENNYSPDLLKYILHSKDFVSFANRITTGDRPRISYEEISDYDIPLAPLEEQHQIVQAIESRLNVADKLEESITQSLQQSEALRQSILKKAFEGRLVH